jgi:hypothetical protein
MSKYSALAAMPSSPRRTGSSSMPPVPYQTISKAKMASSLWFLIAVLALKLATKPIRRKKRHMHVLP